jgi:arylsulfatase A-like enzyme
MAGTKHVYAMALMAAVACAPPADPRVENAVVICLDTLRFDTLELVHELLGDDEAGRWWSRGTRVQRAQSSSPWTLPAVATVLTGLYPNRHGAGAFPGGVANLSAAYPTPLPPETDTLAARLAERGFETVGFAAHGWFEKVFGLQRGFDELDIGAYTGDDLQAKLAGWIARRAALPDPQRFFLYLHYLDAHTYGHLPREEIEARVETLPAGLRERAFALAPGVCNAGQPRAEACRRYLAYVASVVDLRRHVANVLAALDDAGWLDETAVVVFSDHGEEFREHERAQRARGLDPRPKYGVGHGHSLYQELLHVPLVFWHPALPAGPREIPASLVDIAPTLLGWLGIERLRSDGPGFDLHEALAGADADPDRPLYASGVAFGPEREAVLRGTRKRIGGGGLAPPLVFDLSRDPAERRPLSDEADALAAELSRYREAPPQARSSPQPDREALRALQALGYLEEVEE